MRADKFVAQNGLYARSEFKQFFKKNRITLNGEENKHYIFRWKNNEK